MKIRGWDIARERLDWQGSFGSHLFKVCGGRWVGFEKEINECGDGHRAAHLRMGEVPVEKNESPQHDRGPKQHYQMEAQVEMAQSCVCLCLSGTRQRLNGLGTRTVSRRGKRCASRMNMRNFVTFVWLNASHSVVHRPQIGEHLKVVKNNKERWPGKEVKAQLCR